MSHHICRSCCSAAPRHAPVEPPGRPASLPTSGAPSLGREAAGVAPLWLEGWHPFPADTLARCSYSTLTFNQALSRASVTSLSARRVKDLSPQVSSPTDPWTDRALAHLAADVTAGRVSLPSVRPSVRRHVGPLSSADLPHHVHIFIFDIFQSRRRSL